MVLRKWINYNDRESITSMDIPVGSNPFTKPFLYQLPGTSKRAVQFDLFFVPVDPINLSNFPDSRLRFANEEVLKEWMSDLTLGF